MLSSLLVNHWISFHMLYVLHLFLSCRWRQLKTFGEEEEEIVSMILGEVRSCLCCYSCLLIARCHLIFITPCTYFFASLLDGDTFGETITQIIIQQLIIYISPLSFILSLFYSFTTTKITTTMKDNNDNSNGDKNKSDNNNDNSKDNG